MGGHLRLRARITLLVAAGAIAVAVGLALVLSNTVRLRHDADATIRSDAYLIDVINLERLVVDSETGLRGYVITGRPLFLAPLHAAQAAFPQVRAQLEQAARQDHAFIEQAQGLVAAAQSYLSSYLPAVLATAAHDLPAARSFRTTLDGKHLVDGIRGRTASLEHLVSARELQRQRTAKSEASNAVTEAIVVLVLLTALTLLLGAVLGRLAVGQELARERSQTTNRTLQESLLPRGLPTIPGCEIAVRFRPAGAGELVGGDFYDVFSVGEDKWAIVLGDVCGKGAEAAAVTAMARWTLRSLSAEPVAPDEALRWLNAAMLRQRLGVRFITIAYLLVTVGADHAQVAIACAGHPAPILVPLADEPSVPDAHGTLLGVWPDLDLTVREVRLTPGDSLLAYSDGVTEQGPEPASSSPIEILRDRAADSNAEQLAARMERYARGLSDTQRDDIAILALRFTGGGGTEPPPSGDVVAGRAAAQRA
jgi:serine phosphatase RsbU (regulator of sigma subunit)